MNSFDMSITILGSVFIVMMFSAIMVANVTDAYKNSPTNFTTSHYLELNVDNNTRDSLEYLSDIKEHQTRENNIECYNRLLYYNQYKNAWYIVDEEYIDSLNDTDTILVRKTIWK